MGCLFRPKLKDAAPLPLRKGKRCTHKSHGREAVWPDCGARFSKTWWAKYYVNGKAIRESTETEKETEARRFLKTREGAAATGQAPRPRVDRILYEEAADDLRMHYRTTGERDLKDAERLLRHLQPFCRMRRISSIGPDDVTRYTAARQAEGKANGTINWEFALLSRMLRLAYENRNFMRLPLIRKLKEAAPRSGFFERAKFEAVKRHLRADLQVAISIEYAYGWRTQSELLTLQKDQVDLNACTIRLKPGMTKNDDGHVVYLTPELVQRLQAQLERIQLLEMTIGRPVPFLFPDLEGRRHGQRINDFRKACRMACP